MKRPLDMNNARLAGGHSWCLGHWELCYRLRMGRFELLKDLILSSCDHLGSIICQPTYYLYLLCPQGYYWWPQMGPVLLVESNGPKILQNGSTYWWSLMGPVQFGRWPYWWPWMGPLFLTSDTTDGPRWPQCCWQNIWLMISNGPSFKIVVLMVSNGLSVPCKGYWASNGPSVARGTFCWWCSMSPAFFKW